MKKIDAAIELIIPDNSAFTVLTALRQLGYHDLKRVERSEHILLSVSDSARPSEIVAQLSRAEVVFNPNKHRLSYAVESEAVPTPSEEFEALVRDRDENNERLTRLLTQTFGMTALRGIERFVGWRLTEENGPATRERLEWACKTLLANEVSQTFDIRRRPVRQRVGEPQPAAENLAR